MDISKSKAEIKEYCHRCHRILDPKNKIPIKGRNFYVCENCAQEKYTRCESCGQYVCGQDIAVAETKWVCLWCASEEYVQCPHCGTFVRFDHAVDFHDHLICKMCHENYFQACDLCHRKTEEDDLEIIPLDGKMQYVCPECRNERFEYCNDCHSWAPVSEVTHWEGHTYCKECAGYHCAICDFCKRTVSADEIGSVTVDGKQMEVCSGCRTTQYSECDECGRTFAKEALFAFSAGCFCKDCLQNNDNLVRALDRNMQPDDYNVEPGDYIGDGLDGSDNYIGDGLDDADDFVDDGLGDTGGED